MQRHTVTNEGRDSIMVVAFAERGLEKLRVSVDPGQSYTGYLLRIIHGEKSAQYSVKPAEVK